MARRGRIKYLSVCSGVEAATLAWHPLGWKPVAFSEIDAFPSAVLAHRFPGVPNWGDLTKFKEWPDADVDVLVGGTPCQSFSVAGLRAGLADPRGNLALTYLAVADRYRPRWLVWENVPGVLSSNGGRDFGAFLGGLGKLGYGVAYRVLDAQYFGVPQRRRRVFVVGCLGDWCAAAAVLFERESLRRDTPPSRETGTVPAALSASGVGTCGADDNQAQGGHLIEAYGGNNTAGPIDVATACRAKGGSGHGDFESETFVTHALRGEGFDASEDGTGRGTPRVPVAFSCNDHGADAGETAPTLPAMGHGASHANAGGQVPVAFPSFEDWYRRTKGLGGTRAEYDMLTEILAFDTTQVTSPGNYSNPKPGDACHPLAAGADAPAVAFDLRGRDGGAMPEGPHDTANIRAASGGSSRSYVAASMHVRRLTPREAERLQGMPDDWTLIPYRKKPADQCPDGPRYKAIGNSMAVPVMRWIGERIAMVARLQNDVEKGAEHG